VSGEKSKKMSHPEKPGFDMTIPFFMPIPESRRKEEREKD